MIASGAPPSDDPPILNSDKGSAYLILSTPLVVAFLDIAPVSRGHILLCPREHREKGTDMTIAESMAMGFWLPVLSTAVMRALWAGTGGSWNVIQANGADAGQTVPHSHFHVIPRSKEQGNKDDISDAERKNLALGEGPRDRLQAEDGVELSKLIKEEVTKEIKRLRAVGSVVDENGELWMRSEAKGLKL